MKAQNVVVKKIIQCCIVSFIVLQFLSHDACASPQAAYRHNKSGIEKLNRKDFQGAINDFKAAHLYSPADKKIKKNLAIAYNNYGFHLMSQGLSKRAIEQFENALSFDSDNPYTLYNLGQVYYNVQNIQKARLYLNKAHSLKPDFQGLQNLLGRINNEESVERSFRKYETMHFVIAYSSDVPVDKLSYIRTYLEEGYGRVGMLLNHYPKKKVVALLYSEADYGALLGNRPHWAMAIFDGKVRIPMNKFKYTNEDVIKIIYHEYAHAVVFDIVGKNCPVWLKEGIASKAEDFVVAKDRDLIRRYIERFGIKPVREIPADFLHLKDAQLTTAMYIESYTLVDFIMKRVGNSGLRTVLDYLRTGTDIERALEQVFGEQFESIENKWKRYLLDGYGVKALRYH
ncbi:peptidase MA family metallohydrolase [Candidatus Omnitrophota bacterium]